MSRESLVTCYNCGCILAASQQACYRCGYQLAFSARQYPSTGNSPTKHGTVQLVEQCESTYDFSELELAPPTTSEMIKSYKEMLLQLKTHKCVYFSTVYNPETGETITDHDGFPDDVVKIMLAASRKKVPKTPRRKKRNNFYLRFQKNLSEEDRLALPHGCPHIGCDYRTKHGWHIKHHMRIHTGEKPYVCDKCEFSCSDPSQLPAHKRRHDNITDFQCTECHTYWDTERGLYHHVYLAHGKEADTKVRYSNKGMDSGPSTCSTCGKMFSCLLALERHENTLHITVKHKCNVTGCYYESGFTQQIARHRKLHHQASYEGKKFPCPQCPFRSDVIGSVNTHIKICHRPHIVKTENTSKDQSSANTSKVSVTKKKRRGRPKDLQCYYCDYTVQSLKQYSRHVKTHDSKTEKILIRSEFADGKELFYCARCKHVKNVDREIVAEHIERCQIRLQGGAVRSKTYHCAKCEYSTLSVHPLRTHYSLFHENCPVEYKCPNLNCDKVFSDLSNLKSHRVKDHPVTRLPKPKSTRSPAAPTIQPGVWGKRKNRHKFEFKCDQCPFSAPTELKLNHHKSFHTGECFQCSWCGLVFYDNNQFMLHEKRHKREDLRRSKTEKSNDLSLTNQSAGAIKNKYRRYRIIKLITPQQVESTLSASDNLIPTTVQSVNMTPIPTTTDIPKHTANTDSVTDKSDPKSVPTIFDHVDTRHIPATLEAGADTAAAASVTASAGIQQAILSDQSKSAPAGIAKLTAQDKKVVSNRVADIINSSGNKPSPGVQAQESQTKTHAPKLAELLDHQNHGDISKLRNQPMISNSSGKSIPSHSQMSMQSKSQRFANHQVNDFLKRANITNKDFRQCINAASIKDLMNKLEIKQPPKTLPQTVNGTASMPTLLMAKAQVQPNQVKIVTGTKRSISDTKLKDSGSMVEVKKKSKVPIDGMRKIVHHAAKSSQLSKDADTKSNQKERHVATGWSNTSSQRTYQRKMSSST